jgi:hypothetical protein
MVFGRVPAGAGESAEAHRRATKQTVQTQDYHRPVLGGAVAAPIHSTFANLPVIQQILIESGVNPLSGIHRFKWPRPRSPKRRLSMSIRFKWAGPPLSVREREGLLMTKYIKEGENGIRQARLDSATTPEEVQAALYGVL